MKSIIITASAFSLCILSACNNNSNSGNKDGETDSISNDTCELVSGELPDSSMEGNNDYMSPDTQLRELHGIVKKCVIQKGECDKNGTPSANPYWETQTIVFDRKGFIDTKSNELDWRLNNPIIKRNAQEQITEVSWYISDFDSYISEEYIYNKSGMLQICKNHGIENEDIIKYEYEGDALVRITSEGKGEGSIFRNTTNVKILETDEQGNWTSRLHEQTFEDGPDDGSCKYSNRIHCYSIEKRTITYYE